MKISPGGEIFNISRGKLIGKGSSWLRGGVLEVNRNVQPWSRSGQVIRISDQAGTVDYKEKLNRSRNLKDGKYRSILEIIGDANYLRYCYQQIKSKKGLVSCSRDFARNSKSNMTRGADKETLDGIDMNWFEKAALDIREGKYKFRPVIIVGPLRIFLVNKKILRSFVSSKKIQRIPQPSHKWELWIFFEDTKCFES